MAAPLRISLAGPAGAGDAGQQEAKQQPTVSVRVCGDLVPGCAVSSRGQRMPCCSTVSEQALGKCRLNPSIIFSACDCVGHTLAAEVTII
jgi:hypothetical protein